MAFVATLSRLYSFLASRRLENSAGSNLFDRCRRGLSSPFAAQSHQDSFSERAERNAALVVRDPLPTGPRRHTKLASKKMLRLVHLNDADSNLFCDISFVVAGKFALRTWLTVGVAQARYR